MTKKPIATLTRRFRYPTVVNPAAISKLTARPSLNVSLSKPTAPSSLLCYEESDDNADASIYVQSLLPSPPSDEDSTISRLIVSESDHMPHTDYLRRSLDRSIDITARQDSINWILKVHSYYNFQAVTALLSVNYLDRFLSTDPLPEKRWPFQLLAVACLSLAAKMEEDQIPLLLDLQIFEPEFVFESKTVQRMEVLVMEKLDWRLRSITPFDFLNDFISKLLSSSAINDLSPIFQASSDLILSTTRAVDFLVFSPSTVAAAAVLCAAGENLDAPVTFHERLNGEMVRSCQQLMEEYVIDTCPGILLNERRADQPAPLPSPVGVLDAAAACVSCYTGSDNPNSSRQAEPWSKRLRSSAPDVQQR